MKNAFISHAQLFDAVYANSENQFGATLLPSYDARFSVIDNWAEYLHSYSENVLKDNVSSSNCRTICYDFYPFFKPEFSDSLSVSKSFLTNLFAVASKAKNINASNWAILQSSAIEHCVDNINLNQMKEQAYAAMAYGAKIIFGIHIIQMIVVPMVRSILGLKIMIFLIKQRNKFSN